MGSPARDVQRLGPDMYHGIDKTSLAFKLLNSMGWKEGQGLGANKQGITEHLKVKKKFDTMGMGAAEQLDRTREWTTGMWTYDQVLAGLKEVRAAPASASADEPDADAGPSKEMVNDVEASGKRKAGSGKQAKKSAATAAKRRQQQKNKDTSSSSSSGEASSSGNESDSDTTASPPPPQPSAAPSRLRFATHSGRYQKRERAKMVKAYSAQDLAAILGAAPLPAAPSAAAATLPGGGKKIAAGKPPTLSASSSSSSSSEDDDDDNDATSSGGGGSSSDSEQAVAVPVQGTTPDVPNSVTRQWWVGLFVRSGRVGGESERQKKAGKGATAAAAGGGGGGGKKDGRGGRSSGFLEADQEALYKSVQDGAVQGKQGLGRAGMPKKVAGARWCGTRTQLGSDGEDSDKAEDGSGDEETDVNAPSGASDGDEGGMQTGPGKIVILAAKRDQAASAPSQPAVATRAIQQQDQQRQQQQPAAAVAQESSGRGKKRKPTTGHGGIDAGSGEGQGGKKKQKQKKVKKGPDAPESDGQRGQQATQSQPGKQKKVKWAKLIQSLLEAAPKRRLTLKKLRKQLHAVSEVAAACTDASQLDKRVMKKVSSRSELFVVDGDVVRLVAP